MLLWCRWYVILPVEARLPFSACLPAELTSSCASQPHFILPYCTQFSLEGKITCAAPSESSHFGADGLMALLYLGTSIVRALGCIVPPSCFRRLCCARFCVLLSLASAHCVKRMESKVCLNCLVVTVTVNGISYSGKSRFHY